MTSTIGQGKRRTMYHSSRFQGENWRASASCREYDPSLFELPDNYQNSDVIKLDWVVKTICMVCPVRADCLADANESDLQWTTRGGLMPTGAGWRGRPRREDGTERREGPPEDEWSNEERLRADAYVAMREFCVKGHAINGRDDIVIHRQKDGVRVRCGHCSRIRREKDNARKRLERERAKMEA